MKIILKNCKTTFTGLKMLANTSSDLVNKYLDKIVISYGGDFVPTGKIVIRHYCDNGEPINWQLFQTESKESDTIVDVLLCAFLVGFGSGEYYERSGVGNTPELSGNYFHIQIWGDIDGYKNAIEEYMNGETGTYTFIDTFNTINYIE